VFREVFAKELTDRTPAARHAFAQKLLAEADKSASVPADQFVLLVGASDAAREADDLPDSIRAIDRLAEAFAVDGLQLKFDGVMRLPARGETPAAATQNCRAAFAVADELVAARDYAGAVRVLVSLKAMAGSNPALTSDLRARMKSVEDARAAFERIRPQIARLHSDPKDPAANLAVGRFLCLQEGDWRGGLPALARGSDETLRSLAIRELAAQTSGDALAALGDGWWDVASNERDVGHLHAVEHAADLYDRARVAGLGGLELAVVEKRLAEAATLTGTRRAINLLPLIDPALDQVSGDWQFDGPKLLGHNGGRLRIPYQVPEEYDFHVVFTGIRAGPEPAIAQVLTHDGHEFAWFVRLKTGANRGFGFIDGKGPDVNVTRSAITDGNDGVGIRHDSLVQVRKTYVAAYLDGQLVSRYDTDFSAFSLREDVSIGGNAIGLRTRDFYASFETIELVGVSGAGSPMPHSK
jgi:hypothetical protein